MKSAVIYARYSSNGQREESIEGQVRACRKYADDNNLNVIRVYADRAVSGRTDARKEFQLMLKHAAANKFDVILVWKNDRIARNRYNMSMFRVKIKKHNVKLISVPR